MTMSENAQVLSDRSRSHGGDLLTNVMDAIALRDARECRVALHGDWAVEVAGPARSGFAALREGKARLHFAGLELEMEAGDLCILLEPGPAVLARQGATVTSPTRCPEGSCTRMGYADGSQAIVGSFALVDRLAHPFLAQLPPLLHLQRADTEGRIAQTLALLDAESSDLGMGSALSIGRLFELLFIQTLRAYMERRCAVCEESGPSWLRTVADTELSPALEAIHAAPRQDWTVASLARMVGMSRTTFATRFRASMGCSPMHYVTRWRLHLGASALSEGATLAEAAGRAGYRAEAAFAKAFKRELGVPPGRFRRQGPSKKTFLR